MSSCACHAKRKKKDVNGPAPAGERKQYRPPSSAEESQGPRVGQLAALEDAANQGTGARHAAQLREALNGPVQRRSGAAGAATGLGENLQSGLEQLSGMDLSGVRVHHNSPKPAQLQALAYTQGQDIHVAPGQESNLPHEGWHVVQQMQGRVRATTELAGTAINDSQALEKEADDMSAKAVQRRAAPIARDGAPAGSVSGPVQRKISYVQLGLTDDVRKRIDEIVKQEGLPHLTDTEFIYGLVEVELSRIDYGVVDLDDDQQVVALYHYIQKQAQKLKPESKRQAEAPETRIEAQEEGARQEDLDWEKQVKTSPLPERTFKTAFLGAGASIAYYIATLGRNYNPKNAIILGELEPWSGKRGPGVVAHPENMITPMREFLGDDSIDDTFLERGKFSKLIRRVLVRSGIERLPVKVTKLARQNGFYEITIQNGPSEEIIYAKKVVSGVGVGAHDPRGSTSEKEIAQEPAEIEAGKRVMDMDVFTRVADRLVKDKRGIHVGRSENSNPGAMTIVLSGGNGAIDVAFDALNKGYQVQWIVGSTGPKFLPGFFNYAAYLPYLRTLKPHQLENADVESPEEEIGRVAALLKPLYEIQKHEMFAGVLDRFLPESTRFEGIYFGRVGKGDVQIGKDGVTVKNPEGGEDIKGDLFVYGLGQDNKAFNFLREFFATHAEKLVPLSDVNQRFTELGETTLGLTTEDRSLEVIGATAFRWASEVQPGRGQVRTFDRELRRIQRLILRLPIRRGFKKSPFLRAEGAYSRFDNAFRFGIGETEAALKAFSLASEELDNYVKTLVTGSLTDREAEAVRSFTEVLAKARKNAQGLMQPVIASLPDNVLINDQLTPTRSQIEATRGFLPYDIGRNVNFITDDRTALAVHIWARYPSLAEILGEGGVSNLIEKIISSRKKKADGGPDFPAIPPHGRDFQDFWRTKLTKDNKEASLT